MPIVRVLREKLEAVVTALGLNEHYLEVARNRYATQHQRAISNHKSQKEAEHRADHYRRERHPAAVERETAKAARCRVRAFRSHQKAQFWLAKIKTILTRIEGEEAQKTQLEIELRALRKDVTIKGNTATGGTPRQRLRTVALTAAKRCAAGRRRNFYSQPGAWDVDHAITGEFYGERSDCSSFVTSVYKSAGLKDPNDTAFSGGYTGTLGQNGRRVMNPKPGDLILYGPAPHHHVEMYVGPGDKTIGHGSAPVDPGVIDLFGDGDYYIRSYV